MIDFDNYNVIVGYGIGQNYERTKCRLKDRVKIHYLADKKWEKSDVKEYDNIPIIHLDELKQLKKALIILFPEFLSIRDAIVREIGQGMDVCYVYDLFPKEYSVRGQDLIRLLPQTEYRDNDNNCIVFDTTIAPNVVIHFQGKDNFVRIGREVAINRLELYCENQATCIIEDYVSVQSALCNISRAMLKIGKYCMLSGEIKFRTHDAHHIFDNQTHERINYPKDIVIEDQVWIGYGAELLAGTHIGIGSVVGERAVTSSSFGDHVIIAGCPAKVIRENICWSRDCTSFFDHDLLEECFDQTALLFLES